MLLEVHQQQEASRQKFSEHLCRTEAEMETNISDVLKSVRAHRDQTQIQELVKAEENQSQTLLALKLEEFKTLRKDDILSIRHFLYLFSHFSLLFIYCIPLHD